MRLLFIAPTASLSGGGEISHYEIIKAAKKRGHKVHVVVPADQTFAKLLRREGYDRTVIQYSWWGIASPTDNGIHNIPAVGEIYRLAVKFRPDCIISNTLNIPWGALAAAMADVPHIWVSREWAEDRFDYLEDRFDFIRDFSNAVLANSKNNASYVMNKTGLKGVGYIYPYIDVGRIRLGKSRRNARFVNVGSIQPRKNQIELIRAAGILHKRGVLKNKIVLVGPCWNKDYTKKIGAAIKQNGVQDFVQIHDFSKNPYTFVGPDDIFIQTSSYETFGRTTVEAMKLGLITVAADIDVTREVIGLGGGTLYKSGDPAALARTLTKVLGDYPEYKKRAKAAQAKALKNLNESTCNEEFFKTLKKIKGQPNPRRELRHLALQFAGLADVKRNHAKAVADHKKLIENHKRDIDNIVGSKAWKTVESLRKAKQLGRRPAKRKKR